MAEFIPGVSWSLIMIIPMILQSAFFDPESYAIQIKCVLIFSAFIFLGDIFPRINYCFKGKMLSENWLKRVPFILLMFCLIFQITHLLCMPDIPLLEKIIDGVSGTELADLREKSSKLLQVPRLFLYWCHVSLLIAAPIGLILFFKQKRWTVFICWFCFTVFYSAATMARTPVIVFLITFSIYLYLEQTKIMQRKISIFVLVLFSILFIYGFSFLTSHPKSILNIKSEEYNQTDVLKKGKIFTFSDRSRLVKSDDEKSSFIFNYIFYRVFLVPAEVSHFWYLFFPDIYGRYLGYYGLTLKSRRAPDFKNPANILGNWAYANRFPELYLPTVSAQSSVDADAYSRWGVTGVWIISLVYFCMRYWFKLFRLKGAIGTGMGINALVMLAYTLPCSSLQAIVVASGLWMYLLIFIIFRFLKVDNIG